MIEGLLDGTLIGWLYARFINFVSSPRPWSGFWFAVALWFTCSLPFALTNVLYTLRGERRNEEGGTPNYIGPPPEVAQTRYWHFLLPGLGLAVVIVSIPWSALAHLLIAGVMRLDPSLNDPLALITFLAFLALLTGVALYWFLYEARARQNVKTFLEEHKHDIEDHIVMIDADGIALDIEPQYQWSYFLKLVPFFPIRNSREFEKDIAKKLGAIAPDAKPIVFIHGGLNDYRPNLRRAYDRYKAMQQDDPSLHPVFVLWRSGLLPCYGDHVWNVRQGRQAARLLLRFWTVPATLIADFGRGFTRVFMTWYYQVITDMKPFTPWFNPDEYSWKCLYKELEYRRDTDPKNQIDITRGLHTRIDNPRAYRGRLASYLNAWTFTVSFAVWPLIDALGKSAWDVMLRRTRTLFRSPYEFDLYLVRRSSRLPLYLNMVRKYRAGQRTRGGTAQLPRPGEGALDILERGLERLVVHPLSPRLIDKVDPQLREASSGKQLRMLLDTPPTGALYEFISRYRDRHAKRPLTLVGHSAGTIVLNRWLESFPDLTYDSIVYMAAACSIKDCVSHVGPYLEANEGARFYAPCLHPRAEQSEAHAADFSPRGSLLEWIDSYFSLPLTHDDRTLGKWENLLQATHLFPKGVRSRVHIKAFGFGEESDRHFPEGNPQMHGAFSSQDFWKESFWTPH